jgi:SAM-dependent methyltransferase
MFKTLYEFIQRPAPFSVYTTMDLWTRPHLAERMLRYHLDQDNDLASRSKETIANTVEWLDRQFNLEGKTLCDLGCGPGLYTTQFAERGATVTGIDFSQHSLQYARAAAERTGATINYQHADYIEDELPCGFDVVTLIYYDFCTLSASQRKTLLGKIFTMLNPWWVVCP